MFHTNKLLMHAGPIVEPLKFYCVLLCTVHNMNSDDLIKFLKKNGFEIVGARGSHHKLRNAANITLIVPTLKRIWAKV